MAPVPRLSLRSARPLVRAVLAAAAVATGVGYLVAVWPEPEPFRAPFPELAAPVADTSFTRPDLPGYVFIGPAAPAVSNPCLGVIAAWDYTRDRTLTIRRGRETLEIEPSFAVRWTQPDEEPRTVRLEPAGLQRLLAASGASCDVTDELDPRFITVEATDAYGRFARTAFGSSDAHAALDRFFDDLDVAWLRQQRRPHPASGCNVQVVDPASAID